MVQQADALQQLAEVLLPALRVAGRKEYGYGEGIGLGAKHDSAGSPITSGYIHGPGGSLSYPGVDPLVFSAEVGNMGILAELPTRASVETNPIYEVLTGFRDRTGSEKSGVCDDAPVAGFSKFGKITSVFGRYENSTPELELNRIGQRVNRGDPMDLRLFNSPIAQSGLFAQGPGNPTNPAAILQSEIAMKFKELGVAFHRQLSVQLWTGNPSTGNTAGGGYKELTSFPLLINDGYIDAEVGTALPSVDSTIVDYNNGRIDLDGTRIVHFITWLYHVKKDRAMRAQMPTVRWTLAMRPEMFWALTEVWPCAYLTYQCQVVGNQRVNINAADQIALRDAMRAGSYLLINGDRVEVVQDDGIPFQSNTTQTGVTSGCFRSNIYLIPMSAGTQALTFLEYMDYGNADMSRALEGTNLVLAKVEGAFLTWPRQNNQCVQWQSKIEPRLVMRTPWLAGRIDNVQYCPAINPAQPFPDDPYHVNGGVSSRQGPSLYNQWTS